jgi:hypothetical protein
MPSRHPIALATLVLVALAGCDQGSGIVGLGGSNGAAVRFVNATGTPVDLTANGQVIGGSGHVAAGAFTSCLQVNPATVVLGIRPSGQPTDLPGFAPTFLVGQGYTVIVFEGETGTTQAVAMSDAFTPTSGLGGLRVFDAAPGTGSLDVYVTAPGEPLTVPSTASIGFGGGTPFFDVNPGTSQVRFTVATTPVLFFDAGQVTLLPGSRTTLVLAPPAAGASQPSVLLLPGC